MAYALGRRLEYFDQPTVRAIVADAEKNNFRIRSLIMGVILSDAFRMKDAPVQEPQITADATNRGSN
jgi:hypothetical protein